MMQKEPEQKPEDTETKRCKNQKMQKE